MDWQYPNTLSIDNKKLKIIYTNQTFGNSKVPRFAIFSTDDLQIASFFGGRSCTDMAILFLEENENPKEFEKPLISFYFNTIMGKIDKISTETQFRNMFKRTAKSNQRFPAENEYFKEKFDILLSIFNNFIETNDKRLTQIENLMLRIIEFIQK
ncbi:MAG: hypothetical protein HWN67_15170 [Candidatus Helarchaeota archaeon]|nr:hypothetical protein [Candidatus Helarchaeota archaeon]